MHLPDTATSRAVIIGVSDYTELGALPAVANNVADMGALFTHGDLWGLPKEHCTTLLNPATGGEVLEAVHDAAAETRDTFVLYFAGHGLLSRHSELCLALPDTHPDRLYRALEFSKLRNLMLDAGGGARNKVVIVDCCFSGAALEGHMGPAVEMADHAEVDGSYVMTASAENRPSLAPPGERFTAFTGELLRVLSEGIPDGPELLDMETIYRSVLGELRAKGHPIPQQRIRNGGRSITLVRNRRGLRLPLPAVHEHVDLPSSHANALRDTPAELAGYAEDLRHRRAEGQADQLLAAAAARWPVQEVAALLLHLERADRRAEAGHVCTGLSLRQASDAVGCLLVLTRLGADTLADEVLSRLACRNPADVAASTLLLVREQQTAAAVRLISLVMIRQPPLDVTRLMESLQGKVRSEVLYQALDAMWTERSAEETLTIADLLRAAGVKGLAFRLFRRLPAALAAVKSQQEIALLLREMVDSGHFDGTRELLGALLNGGPAPLHQVRWAFALRSLDLDWADQAAREAVSRATPEQVLDAAAQLRRDHPGRLLDLFLWASEGRDACDVVRLADALRDVGRPLDSQRLLETTAERGPVVAGLLVAALRGSPHSEPERLLKWLARQPAVFSATAALTLRDAGLTDDAGTLVAAARNRPQKEVLEALVPLTDAMGIDVLHAEVAAHVPGARLEPLLGHLWTNGRLAEADRLLELLADGTGTALEDLLSAAAQRHKGWPQLVKFLFPAMGRLTGTAVVRVLRCFADRPSSRRRKLLLAIGRMLYEAPPEGLAGLIRHVREQGGREALGLLDVLVQELFSDLPGPDAGRLYAALAPVEGLDVQTGVACLADRLDFLEILQDSAIPEAAATRLWKLRAQRVGQAQAWREQGRDADAVRAWQEWSSPGNTRHGVGRRMAPERLRQAGRELSPASLSDLLSLLETTPDAAKHMEAVFLGLSSRQDSDREVAHVVQALHAAKRQQQIRRLSIWMAEQNRPWQVAKMVRSLRDLGMEETAEELMGHFDADRGSRGRAPARIRPARNEDEGLSAKKPPAPASASPPLPSGGDATRTDDPREDSAQPAGGTAAGGGETVPKGMRWRVLSVTVAGVVGVGLGLELLLVPGGSKSPAGHGASPSSSSASPTRTALPGRPAADDVADIGSQPVNTAAIMELRACTGTDITVRLASVRNSYADDDPHLKLTVRADTGVGGSLPCRINLSRTNAYLLVTRAAASGEMWRSSACTSGHDGQRWVQLARSKPVTVDFHWDRTSNTKGCDQAGTASSDTYLAEAVVLNEKATTSFVLEQLEQLEQEVAASSSNTPSPSRSASTAPSGWGGGTTNVGGTTNGGGNDEKSATPTQSASDQPTETAEPTSTDSGGGNGGLFGGADGG
ncbi:caspase family protein [Streptomyces sp. NPDC048581]|uniref:caspase, EACC1-associated type n=1 Tax=Streptomyces sp. NPDC048581 TaxID=3365572 RepID=UPI0037146B9C